VGFGDISHIDYGTEEGGTCPLMIYCKKPEDFDILIPDGQFTQFVSACCLAPASSAASSAGGVWVQAPAQQLASAPARQSHRWAGRSAIS